MNSNTLGSKLRAFRRGKGWTQKYLADQSGLSSGYIGLLELNQRRPERKKLARVCQVLELSPEETDDLFLTAGYSPNTKETQEVLHTFLQRGQTALVQGATGTAIFNVGAAATGKHVTVTPEVLRPLGPFISHDGKFSITIWREPYAERNFLLIQDVTKGREAEGLKITLLSNDPDNRQLVAQGYITYSHLALSVNCEIKLPLSWTIKTEAHETSKGEAP